MLPSSLTFPEADLVPLSRNLCLLCGFSLCCPGVLRFFHGCVFRFSLRQRWCGGLNPSCFPLFPARVLSLPSGLCFPARNVTPPPSHVRRKIPRNHDSVGPSNVGLSGRHGEFFRLSDCPSIRVPGIGRVFTTTVFPLLFGTSVAPPLGATEAPLIGLGFFCSSTPNGLGGLRVLGPRNSVPRLHAPLRSSCSRFFFFFCFLGFTHPSNRPFFPLPLTHTFRSLLMHFLSNLSAFDYYHLPPRKRILRRHVPPCAITRFPFDRFTPLLDLHFLAWRFQFADIQMFAF